MACYLVAACVLLAAVVIELNREDVVVPRPAAVAKATPAPTAAPTVTPVPAPPDGKGLAVGVTEFNPNLVATPEDRTLPEPWSGVRDKLGAIRPAYFRLVLDWASIQPTPEAPANLASPQAGCMREVGPCLGWGGVREQLRALASRQREGGWRTLVVVTSTPDWAAEPAPAAVSARRPPPARARRAPTRSPPTAR